MKKAFVLLFTITLGLLLVACGNPKTTGASDSYVGVNYELVVSELKEAGFNNVELKEIQDLTSSSDIKDGSVEKVSINGSSEFSEGSEFEAGVPVLITYHTIPKVSVPISLTELQEYSYEDVATMFSEAGFENVDIKEVYDLNPEVCEVEFENEVMINGDNSFDKKEKYPFDSEIIVVCHRPYEIYSVNIHVDFVSNFLFSTYDVILSVDGEEYTMEHGEDGDFEFNLKEGSYLISFVSNDSSSVKGEASLDVYCDVEAAFQIYCHSKDISIKTLYIDNKEPIAENEAKVMAAESSFKHENYKTVISTIKDWGFTNIVENPMYDISFGFTEEGSVDSVTINGSTEYTRGDVIEKDAEVVVSYHMNEDDDPTKIKVPYDTESAKGLNYMEVVEAFEKSGFKNVSTEKKITMSSEGNAADTVANIYIEGIGTFDTSDAFLPDAEVIICYYTISNGNSKSSTELTLFYAQKAFEKYGEALYPYGFECHWLLDYINREQYDDGSWFLKVGVTIKNAYGNKIEAVAEGLVAGTDTNPKIVQFNVN